MPKKRTAFNIAVGKRLESLRLAKGFKKIRAWANYVRVHEDTWRAWEKGDNGLPAEIAKDLEERFGATTGWLYNGNEKTLTVQLADEIKSVSA